MPIPIAIIGCGQWGMNHVRNFSAADQARVTWCCDASPERLAAIRRQYPNVRTTHELSDVLNDSEVQAVVVATPTGTHFSVVKAALERGKHVLCEKPLTTRSAECETLIRLAAEQKRLLMVGHVFLFNAAVRKLREYLQEGKLGRLYYLSARRTNLGPIRSDADSLWDLASHDISIFDYLLDGAAPVRVSAFGGAFLNAKRADVAFVSMEYPNNIVANIQVSWLDPQKRREITVVGAQKMAIFNDMSMDAPLWLYDKGAELKHEPYESFERFRVLSWDRDATVPKIPPVEPLGSETRHFLECIAEGKRPLTDGENGLRVIRVLEAASRSMEQGGAPVGCA